MAKRRFDLVAFRARLKVYDSLFSDRNHKAFSRFCLYPGEKSGLDRLEERGLVERVRSLHDRRIVNARLTSEGEIMLAAAPELLDERFMHRFAMLPEEERLQLMRSLRQIAALMGVGLLYQGSAHRLMTEVRLDQISAAPRVCCVTYSGCLILSTAMPDGSERWKS